MKVEVKPPVVERDVVITLSKKEAGRLLTILSAGMNGVGDGGDYDSLTFHLLDQGVTPLGTVSTDNLYLGRVYRFNRE